MNEYIIRDNNKLDAMDTALMANYLQLSTNDIEQTNQRLVKGNKIRDIEYEVNPLVKPLVEKAPDAYMPLGILGQTYLANRWANEPNSDKRKQEMLLANLVEAGALAYSEKPWKLQFGVNF